LDLAADLRGLAERDVLLVFAFALPRARTGPLGAFMTIAAPRRGS
jgi:hypothetical protein